MSISVGIVGAGHFGSEFAELFALHPTVSSLSVTDSIPERATEAANKLSLEKIYDTFENLLASDVDAVAIFTQRWMHGPMVVQALRAGKHVYSAVPMAFTLAEVTDIITAVRETGLVYMMGETSFYNPAAVFGRQKLAAGEFGEIFYAEGDYLHDMSSFYGGYQHSGGEKWKATASFPPMHYATHSIGGVLSVVPAHAVGVSCIGIPDHHEDGVFDKSLSIFDNDVSNASALFELSNGGAMRINEMRRIGYPTEIRESRFRYFGTEGCFEQLANVSLWQTKTELVDVTEQLATEHPEKGDSEKFSYGSGYAAIQDSSRIPRELVGAPNGHEGVHHFLVDDFVTAVDNKTNPPINAWVAARFTVPGIIAHQSAELGGTRLPVPDFGDSPLGVGESVRRLTP